MREAVGRQLRLDRAVALCLRGLPRRADARGTRRTRPSVEAKLKAPIDGEEIPFRMLRPTIANSDDRDRRERIERVRNELTEEHLNPILLAVAPGDARGDDARSAPRATASSTTSSTTGSTTSPRSAAPSSTRPSRCTRTRPTGCSAQSVGVGLAEAQRWDVARVFRATKWDPGVPRRQDAARARGDALRSLGIDLRAQENVHLDVEERPHKTPARVLLADRGAAAR